MPLDPPKHTDPTPEEAKAKSLRSGYAAWPYDADPRPLEPAQNGFIWCDTCHQVRPAAGHKHDALPGPLPENLHEAVFMAIGDASMCWGEVPLGVFDSDRAKRIAEELLAFIGGLANGLADISIAAERRAELAESLLLRAIFEHVATLYVPAAPAELENGWLGYDEFWADCLDGQCVFCDAERKHEVRL